MNRKLLLIFGALLGLIIVISLVVFLFRGSSGPSHTDDNTLQGVLDAKDSNDLPQGGKISIPTKDGGEIMVNNVFKDAFHSGDQRYQTYKLSNEVEYNTGGGGAQFVIRATGTNADLQAAEQRFLSLLGISQSEGCELDLLEYLAQSGGESLYVRNTLSSCENLR